MAVSHSKLPRVTKVEHLVNKISFRKVDNQLLSFESGFPPIVSMSNEEIMRNSLREKKRKRKDITMLASDDCVLTFL